MTSNEAYMLCMNSQSIIIRSKTSHKGRLQIQSLGGLVILPERVWVQTSSPSLQSCWRRCDSSFLFLSFNGFFSSLCVHFPPWGSVLRNSFGTLSTLASSQCSLWTGVLRSPFFFFSITVRTNPSCLGNNFSTRPIGHFPLATLSSEISTKSPTLRAGCSVSHFGRMDNCCRHSPHQRFQKWLIMIGLSSCAVVLRSIFLNIGWVKQCSTKCKMSRCYGRWISKVVHHSQLWEAWS